MANYNTRNIAGRTVIQDRTTFESLIPYVAVRQRDDFMGKAIDTTTKWTALDTSSAGLTTPVLVANSSSGVVSLPLDATSEVQLTGLYQGDVRNFVLNQGLVFETRLALHTLPTGSVIFCAGLIDAHNATADSVGTSIWFRADGNGAITVETDDTTNETSKVATGVTVLADVYHIFRIDCSDPTSVKFYIDGAQVAASTTFDVSTVPTIALQQCVRLSKGAATTVGEVYLDYTDCWQNRS